MKILAAITFLLAAGAANAQTIGTTSAPATPASNQTTVSSAPTAPSSTSVFQTAGLGASGATLTPTMTGTVEVTISGNICIGTTNCSASGTGTAATTGIKYQIYWGTGTAPANGTSVASNCSTTSCTAVGVVQTAENGVAMTAGDYFRPFSINVLITGLTVGTATWFDLGAESIGVASGQGFSVASVTVKEVP